MRRRNSKKRTVFFYTVTNLIYIITVEKKDSIVIIVYKLCAIQDNKREKQGKRKDHETSPSPSISAVPDYTKDA